MQVGDLCGLTCESSILRDGEQSLQEAPEVVLAGPPLQHVHHGCSLLGKDNLFTKQLQKACVAPLFHTTGHLLAVSQSKLLCASCHAELAWSNSLHGSQGDGTA